MRRLIFPLLVLSGWPAFACEVTPFQILFDPGMGTHTAYYCKANEEEKREAIERAKKHDCIPEKLRRLKEPVVLEEALDVQPYWFTKADAEQTGPILEARIVLKQEEVPGGTKQMGYRVLVTGKEFKLDEPWIFYKECLLSGCNERYKRLCRD